LENQFVHTSKLRYGTDGLQLLVRVDSAL
jgi:hypothetical protein